MEKYDLIVIGAGPAGYTSAIGAGKLQKNVLIIEKDKLGGVCLNEGCIPTKTFYNFAKIIYNLKKFNIKYEIDKKNLLKEIIEYKNNVVKNSVEGIKFLFKKNNVQFLQAEAILKLNQNDLIINANSKNFTADYVIIATGSNPVKLFNNEISITSEEFINLEKFPDKILIIGAGVIGCELAFIFSNFGIDVYLVEKENKILPGFDNDLSLLASKILNKNGVKIFLNCEVLDVIKNKVKLNNNEIIEVDKIIFAAGRKPNSNLVNEIVKKDEQGFIIVDENYRTSNNSIFAIGDVINKKSMYANLSIQQAKDLINYIFLNKKIPKRNKPLSIFLIPQISAIGLSEEDCKKLKINYKVKKISLFGTSYGRIANSRDSFIKFIYSEEKILGIQLVSENSSELINLFAFLLEFEKDKIKDILENSIFIHPSEFESFKFIEI